MEDSFEYILLCIGGNGVGFPIPVVLSFFLMALKFEDVLFIFCYIF